jgi:hypothetical protein
MTQVTVSNPDVNDVALTEGLEHAAARHDPCNSHFEVAAAG